MNGINGIHTTEIQMSTQSMQRPPRPERPPKSDDAFKQLSLDAGGDGKSISKNQLQSLIDEAQENGKDTGDLESLLSNFDKISNGSEKISLTNFDTAIENGILSIPNKNSENNGLTFSRRYNFQDPYTITASQLEPPIDLRV